MSLTDAFTNSTTLAERLTGTIARHRDLSAVLKGAAQVLAIRMTGAVLVYASMVLLARWLGAFEFGIYAYVWVWVVILATALPLGYTSAALRFLPNYLARQKWRRLQGFLKQSFAVAVGISIVVALACAGLVFALRGSIETYYVVPLIVGCISLPFMSALGQMEATARPFGWVQLAYTPNYIARPLLLMAAIFALVMAGLRPTAVDALWILALSFFAVAAVQAIVLFPRIIRALPAARPVQHTRHWATVSLSFVTIDGLRMVLENCDVLVIGKLLNPHSVAVYYAAIRTGGLVAFLYFAVVALAAPKFATIHASGTREDMQRFVSGIIKLTFWPSAVASVALACIGPFALALFGSDFAAGLPSLFVVLSGLMVRAATGPVEYMLNMTGHHKDTMRVYAIAAIASIALNLLLVPAFGVIGAAISAYGVIAGANLWLCWLVRKRLKVTAFIVPLP